MTDAFRGPRVDVPEAEALDAELGQVDVVFVIDATGSMSPYINEARRRTREEAVRIAQTDALSVRIGMVAYRDHLPQDRILIAAVYPLTESDNPNFEAVLQNLSAAGGGDGPEAVFDGLNTALTTMQWRPRSDRFIFLIGDAPPHGYGQAGDAWPAGCPCGTTAASLVSAMNQNNVRVDAVSIAGDETTTRAFTDIASATGGTVAVATRPAEQTAAFASSLGTTSDSIGRGRLLSAAMRMAPDGGEARWSVMTGMSRAGVTSTRSYLARRGIDPTAASTPDVVNPVVVDEDGDTREP